MNKKLEKKVKVVEKNWKTAAPEQGTPNSHRKKFS